MRLWRYVALELVVATAAVAGGGVGVVRGSSILAERFARAEAIRIAGALSPHGDISVLPDPIISNEPAGMFLGMSDELLLDRVRRQSIVATKLNKGGSSISFRLEFADGSRAAFKPVQTNLQTIPRKEVAAYRINRLLGLNAVPPATPRTVSREELLQNLHPDSRPLLPRILAETLFDPRGRTSGMVQYWIPKIVDSSLDSPEGLDRSLGWLTVGNDIPLEDREMAAQVSDLIVFDFITANPDRYSGGNMKVSPDGKKLYFMDNTMAFFLDAEGPETNRRVLDRTQRFSRNLREALRRLTPSAIHEALEENDEPGSDAARGASHRSVSDILTPQEIRAVVSRRQAVERRIDGLVAMYGERPVLLFP